MIICEKGGQEFEGEWGLVYERVLRGGEKEDM